jgi:UDP-N-acetylglucosamine 2-epimerase (non-hydrolysing)
VSPMKIHVIAGARPNFMKIAPILRAGAGRPGLEWSLVHTGQHYDYAMSKVFFDELGIPEPQHFLNSGSGSHAEQTARVMVAYEGVCLGDQPDLVVVVGDVNSTLACSVTAKKLRTRVAHVEAGLRSRDLAMPEEINRMVTDAISDLLFVSEPSGVANLRREGHAEEAIQFVGNVMVDTLLFQVGRLTADDKPPQAPPAGPYAVVTLHRPSNVDEEPALRGILGALKEIARDLPVIFPAHPRTRSRIEAFGLEGLAEAVQLLPPLPYNAFLALWKDAELVLTDSGGLQEETTALGVPCFTIRENTERPVTVELGTNTLVGATQAGILEAYAAFRRGERKSGRVPPLWDGRAAERIVRAIEEER